MQCMVYDRNENGDNHLFLPVRPFRHVRCISFVSSRLVSKRVQNRTEHTDRRHHHAALTLVTKLHTPHTGTMIVIVIIANLTETA